MFNKKNKFACPYCGEKFRLKYNYLEHIKKHKNDNKTKM